ncbi:SDR family NAD(P)-dependent oxidoreductase [Corallococcus praedator]|uniref:SDR family NAD(P)-dependent oxidoreductase n=1 Tax=Corallococcus praedator TaxID=2316724 RepID=A0ABX9QGQ4_9BACT|nr:MULTISPECIES: SDR family NAD(P)-dependent oxidoreductase [Corallococcus]RKH27124.1 SDR family NAD(P)-dependent oxidoreductase [Corallococcus sp. CA031C]RKI06078.1 SDR family NAD(P)-dependent oxidoreductase [Corallococcus praedator]
MNVLVTGATGLIGNAIAHRLAKRGDSVRALVRDVSKAAPLLPPSVQCIQGDITAPASLPAAMHGVDIVFHAAGMPEQWHRDDSIFDRVNRQGSVNVLSAAHAAKVRRVVYTSTMDVFAAPRGGEVTEANIDAHPKPTVYERSKQDAERAVEAIRQQGLDVVYINPSAVYGPSPVHVGLNSFFIQLLNKKAPLLPPGGMSCVYVDGLTDAQLAAAERGVNGERYLVSDQYMSNADLALAIHKAAGAGKPPATAPVFLMEALARASAPLARVFPFTPLVAPGQLSFMRWEANVNSARAQRELDFRPTPLEQGVARTVAFLREKKLVPQA